MTKIYKFPDKKNVQEAAVKLSRDEVQKLAFYGFYHEYKRAPTLAEGVQIVRHCDHGWGKFLGWFAESKVVKYGLIGLWVVNILFLILSHTIKG